MDGKIAKMYVLLVELVNPIWGVGSRLSRGSFVVKRHNHR